MRLFLIALLILFYGCTQPPEDDPNLQERECYAAADGGIECYNI